MSDSRLETRLGWRRRSLLAAWLLGCGVVVARAAQLQVLQGAEWREIAAGQHRMSAEVPAPRGTVYDRDGVPLAITRETFKVEVAPRELADPEAARGLLREVLGINAATARRVTDADRSWAVVPGVFEPSVRGALSGVQGIYLRRELRRDYPHGELALGVLGRVLDGEGRGGIEQAFDSLLRGTPGREVVARDSRGRELPGQVFEVRPPVAGGDVTLTLDADLQEIAQQALLESLETTGARGGDIIVTDPSTGEILALVSVNGDRTDALSVINTPYEPGSTLKPFTVAGVLKYGRGSLEDSVDVGNGSWRVNGRTLSDVHSSGMMTVAQALRESSNVGVAKAAQGLLPGEQFENLRDFGFGMGTGLPLPGEVSGRLRHPDAWQPMSSQSLAIGYEVSVTPLQMAMAYGALANGGRLMEARVVRSLRPAGGAERAVAPRVIRQVVDPEIAHRLGRVLVEVVEDGTGTRAQLETFQVAGKSGTSRLYGPGGYIRGRYFASFVGYFPADDPQLVIFVKLDSPQGGTYYGGATAAPVTRATMEAALAARQTPLDRRALLRATRRAPETRPTAPAPRAVPAVRFAALEARWDEMSADLPPLDAGRPEAGVPVPDLRGTPSRVAVRRLHALGLRVVLDEPGAIVGTVPRAGSRVVPGDTVRLRTGRSER